MNKRKFQSKKELLPGGGVRTRDNLAQGATGGKPKLLEQVRELLRAKYYSIRTEEAYLSWIRRFILFSAKRHPKDMGGREVARFLSHLATRREVSPSTQNQAFSALLFLYQEFLGRPLGDLGPITRAQRERKVPVVLTKAEVKRLLAQLEGVDWVMAMLLYGSGLRLLEMLRLRVKDVDFGYGRNSLPVIHPLVQGGSFRAVPCEPLGLFTLENVWCGLTNSRGIFTKKPTFNRR